MTYQTLIQTIWKNIYNPNNDTREGILKYFHPDYEQCINGITMDRKTYIDHVIAQKHNLAVETIEYKHMLESNNELFSIYYPMGRNKEGALIVAEVIAYFKFKDKQIYHIHGQVRMIEGDYADADMCAE